MARFSACGVTLDLPESWEDRSLYQFVAPRTSSDERGPRPSISLTDLGPQTLERALEGLEAPAVESLTVLRAELRTSDAGPFYERVIRFSDPGRGTAVQQSLRLVEARGHVYAFGYSAQAQEFNDGYRLFAQTVQRFVIQRLSTGHASPSPVEASVGR